MNSRLADLTGCSFGMLSVIKRAANSKNGHAMWLCRCQCGSTGTFFASNLKRGHTNSCGCARAASISSSLQHELPDRTFGRLTALRRINGREWLCVCECGNETVVATGRLTSGNTRSCGCLQREVASHNGKQVSRLYGSYGHKLSRLQMNPDIAGKLATLYLAEVNGSVLKIGFTTDIKRRGHRAFTGILYRREMPRAYCWAAERAALWETRAHELAEYPDWLTLRTGRTELRQGLDVARTIELLDRLADRCEVIGWEAFWEELEAKQRLET